MATGKSLEIYILLQDEATITNSTSVGKKASKFSLGPKKKDKHKSKSTQYVPAGTLLRKDLLTDGQEVYIPLLGSKLEDCHLRYASSVVAKLMSNEEYDLLALISSRTKRIEVYKDKAWMEEGLNLKPKDGVQIHGHSTIQDGTHGIVKSKRCEDGHPGTLFDIQLSKPEKIVSVTIENIRKCQTHSPTGTHHSPKPPGANLPVGGVDAIINELKKKQKTIKPECTGGMSKKSFSKSMDSLLDDRPTSLTQGGLQNSPSVENVLDDKFWKPSSTLNRNPHTAGQKHVMPRELESPTNNLLQRSRTLAAPTRNHQGKVPFTHSKPLNRLAKTKSQKCTGGMGKKSHSKSMNSLLVDDLPTSPTPHSSSVENAMDNDHLPVKPSCTSKRKFHKAGKKHAAVHELESSTNNLSQRSHGLAAQTENHPENIPFTNSKPLTQLAVRTERQPLPLPSLECTGGMGKKSRSKSMENLMDDLPKSSKRESPSNRNPPELESFPLKKSPPQSSGSHSSSGHPWGRASGPEEDDDRKYHAPSPTSIPGTTSNTPILERFKVERIDGDDEDDMPGSADNDPTDEGICIHDDHYSNDVPGQVRETVEEETEPGYVNVPRPGRDQRRAAENEAIYANLPLPIEAGAVASTVDNEDTYGLFSPRGFFSDHNEVFAPCEQRLQEQDHPYEDIEDDVVDPDDIFDQTYPLDPNQQYTGTCVIIDQFTHDRKGSFTDVRSIYELFEKKFKFRMDYQKNLSKKEFLDVFKKHRDYMANPATRVQRFVCFILGHGDEKGIMTCVDGLGSRFHIEEGARIDINKDLLPFLSSSNLQTMAGKPKLMFIQACRGRAFQGGQGVQGEADPHDGIDQGSSDETTPRPHVSIPDDSDILVAYAQTAGNQAFRDLRAGSWFIQAVADIFRDYHERYDVLSMMTLVSNAVSYMSRHNPDGSEHKQSPTVQHTLRKKMFMLKASA